MLPRLPLGPLGYGVTSKSRSFFWENVYATLPALTIMAALPLMNTSVSCPADGGGVTLWTYCRSYSHCQALRASGELNWAFLPSSESRSPPKPRATHCNWRYSRRPTMLEVGIRPYTSVRPSAALVVSFLA